MKKLLYIFMLFITIVSCSTPSWVQLGNGNIMRNSYELDFTKSQFDSVCKAEDLPTDLSLWLSNHMRDYETKNPMYRYMFIKRMDSLEVLYILDLDNEKYNFTKRITE